MGAFFHRPACRFQLPPDFRHVSVRQETQIEAATDRMGRCRKKFRRHAVDIDFLGRLRRAEEQGVTALLLPHLHAQDIPVKMEAFGKMAGRKDEMIEPV